MRPFVLVKAAISLDGCIDDAAPNRKIFSNAADANAVAEIRAGVDAILVGAETIRRDNPKLLVENSPKAPLKVTLTDSGNLSLDTNFFRAGLAQKIVYVSESKLESLGKKFSTAAEVAAAGKDRVELKLLLEDLHKRGVRRLLVEGGSKVIAEFLQQGLADELRLAISPELIADKNAPQLISEKFTLPPQSELKIRTAKNLDGMLIVEASL